MIHDDVPARQAMDHLSPTTPNYILPQIVLVRHISTLVFRNALTMPRYKSSTFHQDRWRTNQVRCHQVSNKTWNL